MPAPPPCRHALPWLAAALAITAGVPAQTDKAPALQLRNDLPMVVAFCARWPDGLPADSPIAALAREPDVAALLQRLSNTLTATLTGCADEVRLLCRLQGVPEDPLSDLMLQRLPDFESCVGGFTEAPPQQQKGDLHFGMMLLLHGGGPDPARFLAALQKSPLSSGFTPLTAFGHSGLAVPATNRGQGWLLASDPLVGGVGVEPGQVLTADPARGLRPLLRGPGLMVRVGGDVMTTLMQRSDNKGLDALAIQAVEGIELSTSWPEGHYEQRIAVTWRQMPGSMLAGFRPGQANAPAQPLPDAPLLQLRGSVDVGRMATAALQAAASRGVEPTAEQRQQLDRFFQTLNGGYCISLMAPAPGSLLPRFVVSLGVANAAPLRDGMQQAAAGLAADTLEQRQIEHRTTQIVHLPNVPPAVLPTICLLDDVLHFADTPATMRALLRQLDSGKLPPGLDAGATPLPALRGQPICEVLFDAEGIANTLHRVYGSVLRAQRPPLPERPLLTGDDVPEFESVTRHLGRGHGAVVLDDSHAELVVAAPVLGPMHAAYLAVAYEMLPALPALATPWTRPFTRSMDSAVAELRLRRVGEALRQWRQQHGDRPPRELAELVPLLPTDDDEPLLVPWDGKAGKVLGKDALGGERALSCSFAVAPQGTIVLLKGKTRAEGCEPWIYETCDRGSGDKLILGPDGAVHRVPADALAAALAQKR